MTELSCETSIESLVDFLDTSVYSMKDCNVKSCIHVIQVVPLKRVLLIQMKMFKLTM